MKTLNQLFVILFLFIFFTACKDDDETNPNVMGTVTTEFDNMVGTSQAKIAAEGSNDYVFMTKDGQSFNITNFQYYISEIKLLGPDDRIYEDAMNVSADANEVTGYYLVKEGNSNSQNISLENVPYGKYNQITFIIGISEEGVQEGAAGGILDPAEGAPFWNWNAGYISMTIEGKTSALDASSPIFGIHIGGWKDIEVEEGETQKFYNNVKTITLDFGVDVTVSESYKPYVHIVADIQKILGDIDFTATNSVHSAAGGVTFANNFATSFVVDHVHQ